jgi:streptomycin 3"-adenylyltransferase
MQPREFRKQAHDAVAALYDIFKDALSGIYLHGSAVQSRLWPQSDIDLLVIISRPITENERLALLSAFLRLSGRHPRREHEPRCLEVIVFDANGQGIRSYPAQTEMTYGEWLRNAYEGGEIPGPTRDPENTLILAQTRQNAIPLFGPDAMELLPYVSTSAVRSAMREGIPALLDGLYGDERNVLLTLSRMWRTSELGDFVSKDAAATWAVPRMPSQEGATLDYARRAYLGEIVDIWADKRDAVSSAAEYLRSQLSFLL